MSLSDQKEQREIRIFKKFITIARLPISRESIQHLREPAPDIGCTEVSGTERSFELVELLDPMYAENMHWVVAGGDMVNKLYDDADTTERLAFSTTFSNACINLIYHRDITFKKARRETGLLFKELAQQSRDFVGEISEFKDKRLRKLLRSVQISRGSFSGPLFSVDGTGWVSDPTERVLLDKFEKAYETRAALELVAYIDRNLMFIESVWRPKTEHFLSQCAHFGQFRKVWIVDLNHECIEFERISPIVAQQIGQA